MLEKITMFGPFICLGTMWICGHFSTLKIGLRTKMIFFHIWIRWAVSAKFVYFKRQKAFQETLETKELTTIGSKPNLSPYIDPIIGPHNSFQIWTWETSWTFRDPQSTLQSWFLGNLVVQAPFMVQIDRPLDNGQTYKCSLVWDQSVAEKKIILICLGHLPPPPAWFRSKYSWMVENEFYSDKKYIWSSL